MQTSEHLRVPEAALARAGALGAAAAAVLAAAVAAAAGASAPAAAGGALLVAGLCVASIPLYRAGSAGGPAAAVPTHMAALGLRLLLGVATFAALARLTGVPMTPFAAGVAAGLVASVVAEMRTAARDPRFWWVRTPEISIPPSTGSERQHA